MLFSDSLFVALYVQECERTICFCKSACARGVCANIVLSHARTVRTLGKLNAYFMLYAGAFYYCANDTLGAIGKGSALFMNDVLCGVIYVTQNSTFLVFSAQRAKWIVPNLCPIVV